MKVGSDCVSGLFLLQRFSKAMSMTNRTSRIRNLLAGALLPTVIGLLLASHAPAAELTLKITDKQPPKELDPAIQAKLQTKAVQLLDGEKPVSEYWFCKELSLQSKPAS